MVLALSLLLACTPDPVGDSTAPYVTDTAAVNPPDVPPEDPTFDAEHLLVVSAMDQIRLLRDDASEHDRWSVAQFVGNAGCDGGLCRAEGITADGDGLFLNWARAEGMETFGGVVRLDPARATVAPTWEMEGWAYPHEVARDPEAPRLLVADAFFDAVLWVPDDGSGRPDAPLASIEHTAEGLDGSHTPNGLSVYRDDGRTFVVVSYRGDDPTVPASEDGRIHCFDVTDPSAPVHVWAFPEEGILKAPHNPTFHWRDGRWVLLYAHSHGNGGRYGTIGVAQTVALATAPTYIADLHNTSTHWGFPRGAELTADDRLIVTDTGLDGGLGTVHITDFPSELRPTGGGGSFSVAGSDQVFEKVELTQLAEGLDQAYRAFLWRSPLIAAR